MTTRVSGGSTTSVSRAADVDRRAAATRSLLRSGAIAGPFYLLLGLVQAFVRDGFDPARHPLSILANGPGGWVQIANFALTGLMVVAAAIGFGRALAPESRWAPRFLAGFGVSLVAAANFVADPVGGFPPGTPEGPPTTVSTSGLLHFVAGALGFVCWAVSGVLVGRALLRRGRRSIGWYSVASGAALGITFFGGVPLSGGSAGIVAIWVSVVLGWTWLTVASIHLHRSFTGLDRLLS